MKKNKKNLKIVDVTSQYTGKGWVYSNVVKEHFFHPRNLLLKDPKPKEYDAVGQVGSPACILGESKVYANPEITPISNLVKGDKVLSHDGTYNSVTRIFRPQYRSRLIKIRSQLGTIYSTPDHLIYAMRIKRWPSFFMRAEDKKRNAIIGWHHAADLERGDICLYPIPKRVKKVGYLEVDNTKSHFDFKSKALPSKIKINEDFLELVGYFISDGYTRKNRSDLGFCFSAKEENYAKRVKTLIKKIFFLDAKIKHRTEHNRINVMVYNIHLGRLFAQLFGGSAKNKHMPEFMLYLPFHIQKGLILGLWRGDGYINLKRRWPRASYSTISYTLAQQLKTLLLRQGIIPSVYEEAGVIRKGVNHEKSYRIHVGGEYSISKLSDILKIKFHRDSAKKTATWAWADKDYFYVPVKETSPRKFNGQLFNLEVKDTHTYVTDAFLMHNCGDVMKMWLKIDQKTERIKKLKWRTFGCGSAIAATSMFSVMVTEKGGMTISKALKIKPQDIMLKLGGLPARKVHCSVLADKAFLAAINNYFRNTGQHQRIIVEGSKIIDKRLNITERDVEQAVLEGAQTLLDVQSKLKVGAGDPEAIPEIEQLIRFYKEKYYG